MTSPGAAVPAGGIYSTLRGIRPWRELGVLGTMLMGLSWGIPWFRSLTQATYALSTQYAFLVFGSMMLAAYLVVRLMNAARLRLSLRRGALIVLLVGSVLVGLKTLLFAGERVSVSDLTSRELASFSDAYALIPDEFIITVAVLLVWRRGAQLATEKIGPRLIQSAFAIGIFMFFVFIFFNTFVTGETLGAMPALFLFAGLMAMGSARVAVISTLRGGRDNPFDRRWVTGLGLSVAGVVGVAAWIGEAFGSGEGLLGTVPRFVIGGFMAVGFLLLTPLFALLYWALYAMVQVLETSNPLSDGVNEAIGRLQGLAAGVMAFMERYLGPLGEFLSRFGLAAKVTILWGIVLGLVLAVVLAVYIRDSRRRALLREQYEQIAEEGLLNALRAALLERASEAGRRLAGLFDRDQRRRRRAAARVRRIYAALMDLCDELGSPRPEAATPLEFLPKLEKLFPDGTIEAGVITQAYQQVRYGELPESRAEVEAVEAAWQRLSAARELKKRP